MAQPDTQAPIAPDAAAPAPAMVASVPAPAAAETGAPTARSGSAALPVVVQPARVIAPPRPSAAPFVNPGPSSAPPMEVRTDVEEQQEEETDAKCDQFICLSILT